MMINVHSYESMGTFDGPGLRLVVFLQGCNFRCLYCANPDTIAGKGGTPTPPEEIVRMAMSQLLFGKRGGITFSGGEPTFQAKALVPLVRELKEKRHPCLSGQQRRTLERRRRRIIQTDRSCVIGYKGIQPQPPSDAHRKKQRANHPHGRLGWKNRRNLFGYATC